MNAGKAEIMQEKQPLWPSIIKFSGQKIWLAILFVIIGLFGIVLPVIPGLLFLAAAVLLIKPEWYEKLKKWFGSKEK